MHKFLVVAGMVCFVNCSLYCQNIIDTSTINFNNPSAGQFFRTYPRLFLDSTNRYIADNYYDSIYDILELLPDSTIIEIGAHTSSIGAMQRNFSVSQKRARLFANYLVTVCNFPMERLVPKGYGESQLLNDCTDDADCTDEEQKINVRLEFKLLDN